MAKMTLKARQAAAQGTEANGYTPAAQIAATGTKRPAGFSQPIALVIYRRESQYGTHPAAKVVAGRGHMLGGAELLRLAAELEEAGVQVELGRDQVGNRTLWIEAAQGEDENAVLTDGLVHIQDAAGKLGWL